MGKTSHEAAIIGSDVPVDNITCGVISFRQSVSLPSNKLEAVAKTLQTRGDSSDWTILLEGNISSATCGLLSHVKHGSVGVVLFKPVATWGNSDSKDMSSLVFPDIMSMSHRPSVCGAEGIEVAPARSLYPVPVESAYTGKKL